MTRTKLADRVLPTYTKGEEIFNMVSHIVGGAAGIQGRCPYLCRFGEYELLQRYKG